MNIIFYQKYYYKCILITYINKYVLTMKHKCHAYFFVFKIEIQLIIFKYVHLYFLVIILKSELDIIGNKTKQI